MLICLPTSVTSFKTAQVPPAAAPPIAQPINGRTTQRTAAPAALAPAQTVETVGLLNLEHSFPLGTALQHFAECWRKSPIISA